MNPKKTKKCEFDPYHLSRPKQWDPKRRFSKHFGLSPNGGVTSKC